MMISSNPNKKAGQGFNLVMELLDPTALPGLMQKLAEPGVQAKIEAALASLDYVHYSRFVPLWNLGVLQIITEFDGVMSDYVLDFAAILDQEFSLILSYMKGQPRLPVSKYPEEFWQYVSRNTRPLNPLLPDYAKPFSAYPGKTVLEILGDNRTKKLPPRPPLDDQKVDLTDVQGNVLRGFRAVEAIHVGLHFPNPPSGRAFAGALAGGEALQVTPGDESKAKSEHCVNVGFTFEGFKALGMSEERLRKFPTAFREGPVVRSFAQGDTGSNAPEHWCLGQPEAGTSTGVHAMVSLYVKGRAGIQKLEGELQALLDRYGIRKVFTRAASKIEGTNRVHFGYRDGIAQPSIKSVHPATEGGQSLSPPGDFLLSPHFKNSRGGFYIGELPAAFAENATYAAVRVIEQHVDAFERVLDQGAGLGVDRELVAAKLMGRWRDGSPLVDYPSAPAKDAAGKSDDQLDAFDYVQDNANGDDRFGRRCPIGAHIRRLNPRGGLVLGVPWGRRIIRRGLPYEQESEKGLFGIFFCGDLEAQFEFLLRVWANQDLSAFGILGTKDAIVGTRDASTPFSFHPTEGAPKVTLDVPPLTRTRGSLYLMMPGIRGLRWLATQPPDAAAPSPAAAPNAALVAGQIDVSDRGLQIDPYRIYGLLRGPSPIVSVLGSPNQFLVLSHALVEEANTRSSEFLKPGKDRYRTPGPFGITSQFEDGLFFMDPPRHTEVRELLNPDVHAAVKDVAAFARTTAEGLLAPFTSASTLEWVSAFASRLPTLVFMEVMGVPETDRAIVDLWTRSALKAHNPASLPPDRLAGATAELALRTYFDALVRACPVKRTAWGAPTMVAALQSHTGCPVSRTTMSPDETMNSALHFALGGYLSTEFLLTTGAYNLLRRPPQWEKLRADRSLLDNALWEMLRYDAPFQMADRWVAADTLLGGVALKAGSLVTLVYGSANRDPFRDGVQDMTADKFDIERANSPSNFGFGGGPHNCIGQALAMTVSGIGIDALLNAFPRASIAEVGVWSSDLYFRTLDKLTLATN